MPIERWRSLSIANHNCTAALTAKAKLCGHQLLARNQKRTFILRVLVKPLSANPAVEQLLGIQNKEKCDITSVISGLGDNV